MISNGRFKTFVMVSIKRLQTVEDYAEIENLF